MHARGSLDTILVIDQGTSSTKVLAVDAELRVLARAQAPVAIRSPRGGRIEQDADEIWTSVLDACRALLQDLPAGADITGLALSTQRESVVAWHAATGDPLGPVLSWQDMRGDVSRLTEAERAEVRALSGLDADPMYSAPKVQWLLEATVAAGVAEDEIRLGTIDSWLVHRLTGGDRHVIEAGNASRTLLMDLEDLAWSSRLLEIFGIPASVLPEVIASDADFGRTTGAGPIPDGTPILAVLADSHAALYGHQVLSAEAAPVPKATYGTGSSIMAPVPDPEARVPGIATTLAWQTSTPAAAPTTWGLEGNVLFSGAGIDRLASIMGLAGGRELSALAEEVESADGARFVPAFAGLGCPWWSRTATATLTGVHAGTTRAHIARAGLDAVAHQICDVLDAMSLPELAALHAGGGATASSVLMQSQADLLGAPVIVTDSPDVSALGAAALAHQKLGHALPTAPAASRRIAPGSGAAERRAAERPAWRGALIAAGVDLPPTP